MAAASRWTGTFLNSILSSFICYSDDTPTVPQSRYLAAVLEQFSTSEYGLQEYHALQLSTRGLRAIHACAIRACAIHACAIRAHNSPLELFARELNRVREGEPCLLEGMQ